MKKQNNKPSEEEIRLREFEARIRRIVLGLAKKITSANKRVDEVLRSQKMLKEGYETIEDALYKYLLGSINENDDTPIEEKDNENDEKQVLENIQTKGKLDISQTTNTSSIEKTSIQIAEKNRLTWKQIQERDARKRDSKVCLNCRHKVWEYNTIDRATVSICNNKHSKKYKKEVNYVDTCKQWQQNTYHTTDPFNYGNNHENYKQTYAKHATQHNKKILAVDLLSSSTIEKEVT